MSFPSVWTERSRQDKREDVRYQLSSTAAEINALGLPPAGAVAITIYESPASEFSLLQQASDASAARALLEAEVGTPRGATGILRTSPPRIVSLAGSEGAEDSYAYTYHGRPNVQVDIVAQHGAKVLMVELDAEPALAAQSRSALELLASS